MQPTPNELYLWTCHLGRDDPFVDKLDPRLDSRVDQALGASRIFSHLSPATGSTATGKR